MICISPPQRKGWSALNGYSMELFSRELPVVDAPCDKALGSHPKSPKDLVIRTSLTFWNNKKVLWFQVDYFRDELLRIERRSRTKSSFENEEKMERLMQKIREKREEDFRTNLSNLASESKEWFASNLDSSWMFAR